MAEAQELLVQILKRLLLQRLDPLHLPANLQGLLRPTEALQYQGLEQLRGEQPQSRG